MLNERKSCARTHKRKQTSNRDQIINGLCSEGEEKMIGTSLHVSVCIRQILVFKIQTLHEEQISLPSARAILIFTNFSFRQVRCGIGHLAFCFVSPCNHHLANQLYGILSGASKGLIFSGYNGALLVVVKVDLKVDVRDHNNTYSRQFKHMYFKRISNAAMNLN